MLAAWAGGIAAGGAVVAWWRIVGPGFLWLAAGTASLFAVPAVLLEETGSLGLAGLIALVVAFMLTRTPRTATMAFAAAAVLLVAEAAGSGVAGALTASVLLGGITSEMLLGHWYLVDPRLPRRALFRLDLAAGIGLVGEVVVLTALGVWDWAPGDGVLAATFATMAVATAILIAAVWFSLREPAYPAVMAATGLSYLAVLTAVGTSVVGRIVASGAA